MAVGVVGPGLQRVFCVCESYSYSSSTVRSCVCACVMCGPSGVRLGDGRSWGSRGAGWGRLSCTETGEKSFVCSIYCICAENKARAVQELYCLHTVLRSTRACQMITVPISIREDGGGRVGCGDPGSRAPRQPARQGGRGRGGARWGRAGAQARGAQRVPL